MLFHSTVRKELARSFGASLVVLVTIVMTMTLIRTLSQASRGSVNPQEVMMVMGYTVLGYLPPILTLSLFIAIVGTLSRMYRDSEMVIWFGAGRGLSALLRPLLMFAWPVLLVIGLLALVIWPWANQQTQELKDRYGRRGDLERVAPGQFQESASGRRVFFLDKDTPDNKSGRNIFISTLENDRETVTSASSGRVQTVGDQQFLLCPTASGWKTRCAARACASASSNSTAAASTPAAWRPWTKVRSRPARPWTWRASRRPPTRPNWPGGSAWRWPP
jgi:lipopolysaccharide export system permease protein